MRTCLVTDRRRLCGLDGSVEAARIRLVEQARRAAAAGVDLVQVREPDLEARDLAKVVSDLVEATRGTATRVVVNDRLDVALACGAAGVHLRGDSVGAAEVRRIAAAPFLIGRSVHSVEEAVRAAGADYLIAGTVFATTSKSPDHPLLGLDGLRAIASAASLPVLAIGGITVDRFESVARAGAAGVAGIGVFADVDALGAVVEAARRRFDTARSPSYH